LGDWLDLLDRERETAGAPTRPARFPPGPGRRPSAREGLRSCGMNSRRSLQPVRRQLGTY